MKNFVPLLLNLLPPASFPKPKKFSSLLHLLFPGSHHCWAESSSFLFLTVPASSVTTLVISFLLGCFRLCISSSLCDYKGPAPSSPHHPRFWLRRGSQYRLPSVVSALLSTIANLASFSSLPESIAVAAVTGELKAVAVFGYGENGEVVVDALLNRGSLSPVKLPNAELLPPSSSASTCRTAPVTILPFCVILICCVASQSLGLIFCFNWKFQLLNWSLFVADVMNID